MKKVIFFLLLLLPFAAASKNFNNDIPIHRVGISAGYNFKNILGDTIRPFEITLKYQFKGRHTFHFSVPFYFAKEKVEYQLDPEYQVHISENNKKKSMYALGFGYDYAIPVYKFISGFFGGEFEYSRLKVTYDGYVVSLGETSPMWNSEVLYETYSIIPYTGIRLSYKHWEAELKYGLYLSRINPHIKSYYKEGNNTNRTVDPHKRYSNEINRLFSFNLTYYF